MKIKTEKRSSLEGGKVRIRPAVVWPAAALAALRLVLSKL
jgi:hypothetical protein